MIISDHEQYTSEWWFARIGVPTASQFKRIVTSDGKRSKSADKYLYELAVEKITGVPNKGEYQSAAMKRGHVFEPEARSLFEFIYDVDVKRVGMCFPDEQMKYAASPDGLFEDTGLEIFCPEAANAGYCLLYQHKAIETADKYQQIQGTMLVGNFDRYFFISYYPGLKSLVIEVKRNNEFIDKLKAELDKFCNELAATVKKLKEL